MRKNRLIYLAVLAGAVIFHAYYTGWFSWYLLMLALAAPIVSLLMTLLALRGAKVRIDMPEKVRRGEKNAALAVEVSSGFIALPAVYATVELTNTLRGETEQRGCELFSATDNVMSLPARHCSAVVCEVKKCAALDYLRLFRIPMKTRFFGTMTVLPRPKAPSPPPDLSRFQSIAFRIKRSGGFAEVHEFREFRPGDSMRDVHWKLSTKTGELIVREPQEPEIGSVVVSVDLAALPKENDFLLDRAAWVSRWLVENGVDHELCWTDDRESDTETETETGSADAQRQCHITSRCELEKALGEVIKSCSKRDRDSLFTGYVARGAWYYHVGVDMLDRDGDRPDQETT